MELELVETEALIEELLRRFEHVGIAGLRGHDTDSYAVFAVYKGNAFTVAGLCQKLASRAINDWDKSSEDFERKDL